MILQPVFIFQFQTKLTLNLILKLIIDTTCSKECASIPDSKKNKSYVNRTRKQSFTIPKCWLRFIKNCFPVDTGIWVFSSSSLINSFLNPVVWMKGMYDLDKPLKTSYIAIDSLYFISFLASGNTLQPSSSPSKG